MSFSCTRFFIRLRMQQVETENTDVDCKRRFRDFLIGQKILGYLETSQMAEGTRRVQMGNDALAMEKKTHRFPAATYPRSGQDSLFQGARELRSIATPKDSSVTKSTIDYIKAHRVGSRPLFEENQQYAPPDNSLRQTMKNPGQARHLHIRTFHPRSKIHDLPSGAGACPQNSIPIFMPPPLEARPQRTDGRLCSFLQPSRRVRTRQRSDSSGRPVYFFAEELPSARYRSKSPKTW
jgi:hypothetical protein